MHCAAPGPWTRRAAKAALGAALATAAAAPAQPPAQAITLGSVSCTRGPLAVQLPRHYPTLHKIGRHTWTDLARHSGPAGAVTTRRIEYIGLRLDLRLSSAAPDRYELVELEVWSRRWAVGPLSVGQPLRHASGEAARAAPDDGRVELVGPEASVELVLRQGRVERATYRCGPRAARAAEPPPPAARPPA